LKNTLKLNNKCHNSEVFYSNKIVIESSEIGYAIGIFFSEISFIVYWCSIQTFNWDNVTERYSYYKRFLQLEI
jgi:hypothetical protein